MVIKLGNVEVGLSCPPYFIADIAANHDGQLDRALKLIELAKESGAHAAKFQNFQADKIVCDRAFSSLNRQQSHQSAWKKSVFEVYADASIPFDWTGYLKEKCDEVGIEYLTSPYDFESVDYVDSYLNYYKIGSGDITWLAILEHIAGKGKPIVLATGASSMEDVERAVRVFSNVPLVLLQCNTNYTAAHENFKSLNLSVLSSYKDKFPQAVLGLSDHTFGHTSVLGAIALGGRVIEKHFTDDRTRVGPDHKFSIVPREWKEMVKASNDLFNAMGDGIKKVEDNESETCIIQRRSLYYTRNISCGSVVAKEDIFPLRPVCTDGLLPYHVDDVVGRVLGVNVEKGQAVRRADYDNR